MLKMTVEKVMKELGERYSIHHCPISEGKGLAPRNDYVFTSVVFEKMFDGVKGNCKVIGIKNVMSAAEVKEKFLASKQ